MTTSHRRGALLLVGGEEFLPGNEAHDRMIVDDALALGEPGPAFVVATAAARQGPDRAVSTAQGWFARLGLQVEELPLRTRGQAMTAAISERAATGSMFYLCGGDPGLVIRTLAGTPAWSAILRAWRRGAVLAGSSAGAMALGSWTLIRARMPGDARREPRPALDLVPGVAVVPHFASFGHGWVPSSFEALRREEATLVGIDERTAAVRLDGEWRVMGAGSVTVIDPSGRARRFGSGDRISGMPAPRR